MKTVERKLIIEPKIRPLVDILNEVPYISTVSSCQGHYLSPDHSKHYAQVIFRVGKPYEVPLKRLAQKILATTAPSWADALVEVYNRLYVLPGQSRLNNLWEIRITPHSADPSENRHYTDRAIKQVIDVISQYINSGKG